MNVTHIPTDTVSKQDTIRIDLYEDDAATLCRILKIAMTVMSLFNFERRLAQELRREIKLYVAEG